MLPKVEIKKWGVIIIGIIVVGLIAYKAYQLHYSNTVWCWSHEVVCTGARLHSTIMELESVK